MGEEEAEEKRRAKRARTSTSKAPPSKKARTSKDKDPDKPKTKKIKIVGGLEAPKQLGKVQADLMTTAEYMEHAEELSWNLHGNEIPIAPRTFTSGNKGWY